MHFLCGNVLDEQKTFPRPGKIHVYSYEFLIRPDPLFVKGGLFILCVCAVIFIWKKKTGGWERCENLEGSRDGTAEIMRTNALVFVSFHSLYSIAYVVNDNVFLIVRIICYLTPLVVPFATLLITCKSS